MASSSSSCLSSTFGQLNKHKNRLLWTCSVRHKDNNRIVRGAVILWNVLLFFDSGKVHGGPPLECLSFGHPFKFSFEPLELWQSWSFHFCSLQACWIGQIQIMQYFVTTAKFSATYAIYSRAQWLFNASIWTHRYNVFLLYSPQLTLLYSYEMSYKVDPYHPWIELKVLT